MTKTTQSRFQKFLIILASVLLLLAVVLNRWYACLPLLAFLMWIIIRWLPPHHDPPKKSRSSI